MDIGIDFAVLLLLHAIVRMAVCGKIGQMRR